MDGLSTIASLNQATLTRPVCQTLGRDTVKVTDWQTETVQRSLPNYSRAARHLGRFSGAYLVDRSLPA